MKYTFEELMKIIFEDRADYEAEFIKKAKVLLCKVCPYTHVIDDYIDYGLDRSAELVIKLLDRVIYALPPLLVRSLISLSDKHKNPFDVERPKVLPLQSGPAEE